MRNLWFYLRLVAAVLAVLPLRLLRGRRRASWSIREEMVWTATRRFVAVGTEHGPLWMRSQERALVARSPLIRHATVKRSTVGGVPGLWCRSRRAADGIPRVLVYFHGGGYVIGSSRGSREIATRLAIDAERHVFVPDYRLGPESRFPAAQEDALAVVRALSAEYGPAQLALAGDSAGGALAIASLLMARDQGLAMPACAVLFSPWTDPMASGGTMLSHSDDDVLSPTFLDLCLASYLERPEQSQDPRLRPVDADLSGLPPLLIQVGEAELFLDQVREFSRRAKDQGVEVNLKVYEDLFHTFQNFTTLLPRAESAVSEATAFLQAY